MTRFYSAEFPALPRRDLEAAAEEIRALLNKA
jgi:hypothetical protein